MMKTNRAKRIGAALLAFAIAASTYVGTSLSVFAADSWPNDTASAEPTFAGYRVKDVKNWSPETDPDAELMRAQVPLQNRNEAFKATQAKTYLESDAQVMLMQGDYGNSFFGSTMYTNEFSEHVLNFWQYTDYYSPWHGAATAYTPQSLYDPVTSDWRARGFEFGIVNIPNPAYTNAAHKNGVMSIACIYFDPTFRPGQTCADMIEKDSEGSFPVADQLIAMAEYYGYDGYFLNQEEGFYEDFKPFMAYLTAHGLWTQWYDTNSTFNSSKAAWLKDSTYGQIHNSVFVNYGSYGGIDTQLSYAESIDVDPFAEIFYGLECNQNKFSGGHSSASNITGLYDGTGNPRASVALFTPSDWYQRGVDELSISSGSSKPLMQQNEYQWMVAERERMFFSGVYCDPTDTGKKAGYSRTDVGVSNASGWVGVADFIAERSVISGTAFYTNFNTGHGVQYFKNGAVSKDEEWTNINIQDILPTWQWWITSTDDTKLTADFDYGTKYVCNDASGNAKTLPYTQVGAYDGGSSLVLYGELSGSDTMHLYKTDLNINANSKAYVTFKKTSSDNASMKLGLIFKDAPEVTEKVAIENSETAGGWTTSTIDLSAYAGRALAAITLEFEGDAANYQMNIGGLKISDSTYKPEAPTGLAVDYAYADGQMIVKWDIESYDTVKQYNLYGVMSDGSRVYLGGTYDDILYVKSMFGEDQSVRLELCAVGKDGTESDPATLTYTYNDKVSNVRVEEAQTASGLLVRASTPGKLSVSFDAPETGAPDSYEFEVTLRNIASADPTNKVYTHTVDGSATSAEISLPISEGREYDLKIYAVKNGVRGEAICYRGWSNDNYSEPIAEEDIRISGRTVRLVDPDSVDWYKMTATFDGTQVANFKRGASSGRQMSFSLSNTTGLLSVVVEDFAGNVSAPTVLQLENGVPVDPTDLITEEHFPDPALLNAVRTQVGVTLASLPEFTGTLDLTGTSVKDLTGMERLTAMTGLNFTNCTAIEDISGLKGCAGLKEINISGCTGLKTLDLSGLGLEKLTGTSFYPNLVSVDISNNKLDLSEGTPERTFLDAAIEATKAETTVEIGDNLVLGSTVVASNNVNNASLFVDGDTATDTYADNRNAEASVTLDLGESKTIGAFSIWAKMNSDDSPRPFGIKTAKIEISDSQDSGFTEVGSATIAAGTAANELLEATAEFEPVTGRYVRITITEWWPHPSGGNDWAAMVETAVYEANVITEGGTVSTIENLVPGSTVAASDNVNNASLFVDGDTATDTYADNRNAEASVTLDLGEEKSISSFTVWAKMNSDASPRPFGIKTAKIEISDSQDSGFTEVGSATIAAGTAANELLEATAEFEPVTGRYVRITITEWWPHPSGGNDWAAMVETAVYGISDTAPVKFANQRPVAYSAIYSMTDTIVKDVAEGETLDMAEYAQKAATIRGTAYETLGEQLVNGEKFIADDLDLSAKPEESFTISIYDQNRQPVEGSVIDLGKDATYTVLYKNADDETAATLTVLVGDGGEITTPDIITRDPFILYATSVEGQSQNELPKFAFDENESTKWCPGSNAVQSQMVIDVGAYYTVTQWDMSHSGVSSDGSGRNTRDFALQILKVKNPTAEQLADEAFLTNDDNWITVASYTNNQENRTSYTFTEAVVGRYFRLNVTKGDSSTMWPSTRIYEWSMTGIPAKQPEDDVDKTALQSLVDEVAGYTESDYTSDSWSVFAEALADAQAVLANEEATAEDVATALEALTSAENQLVERADNSELAELVESLSGYTEENYTPETWAVFAEALADAQAVLDNENATAEEIAAAIEELDAAVDQLVGRADKSTLEELINSVADYQEDDYTSDTWAEFADALADAETVLADENASEEEVSAAVAALDAAKAGLIARGNKTELSELVDEAHALTAETIYTESTQNALDEAIAAAETVLADADATQEEVDAAKAELQSAIDGLVDVTELTVLCAAGELVRAAEEMFTADSFEAFIAALEEAEEVLGNPDATQEEVDAAAAVLNAAGEALKEAGESDTLSGLVDSAKKEDLSKYTDESADAIRDAIAKAEEVIANRGSEEDLAEAYEALQNALNNAQLKPATPVTPENPDTGDGTPFALPLVLTLAAGAVLALRRRYGER